MSYKIALIKGDGVGPEISNQGLKVLRTIEEVYNKKFEVNDIVAGGAGVDKYGDPLPQESLERCLECDSVLIGNIGGHKWNNVPLNKKPVKALLKLREEFKVCANLRPIKINNQLRMLSPLKEEIISKGVDMVVVRDLSGSVICGEKKSGVGKFGREASDLEYYNESMIKNAATIAFDLAKERSGKVSSIDKSNVLASSSLWREVINEVARDEKEVKVFHHLVDTAAMEVLINPEYFDVIVTSNMFGDILADELSQITGAACMLPSAEINLSGKGVFTPNQLHCTDESIVGKDKANPIGFIETVSLMLRYSYDLNEEASIIEKAIEKSIEDGYRTTDIFKEGNILVGTEKMGDIICDNIRLIASNI